MNNEQKIIDKIISDAKSEAEKIVKNAKLSADKELKAAQEKVDKQLAAYKALSQAEAEKAASKELSGADMTAKKMILSKKQECLENVIQEAKEKLLNLSGDEYIKVIENMLDNVDKEKGQEIVLSFKDKDTLKDTVSKKGFKVSERTGNFKGGFIVTSGDIEYNYSFESIINVERENIEQLAAQILFG